MCSRPDLLSYLCRRFDTVYEMKKTWILAPLLLVSTLKLGSITDVVENVEKRVEFSWDSVIEAIIEVESSGDSLAVCDIYCGAMQISPIVVADCNETLAKRGETRRYTLQDRFSVEKSKEMFCLIQDRYNPEKDVEKAIRVWNAGPSYTLRSTETYYRKVVSAMNID